ncbi:MAG: serine--tRNA ligase [Phycisphaerales bacterium]|nr:serine--tRNA ligase [Phycisphaerales bacterium]
MIDLKQLRDDPDRYVRGAARKGMSVDIDRILALDGERRRLMTEQETLRADQNRLAKETGPAIGKLSGQLKKASGDERARLEAEIEALKNRPAALKGKISELDAAIAAMSPELDDLLLRVPMPPDEDVPDGTSSDDNVEIRTWHPEWFDPAQSFEANRGFAAKTHIELIRDLGLVDFERGVKLAGSRSYVLTGDGMRLHLALLRYATDVISREHGFSLRSVPVLVREECMVGTGFFPDGREQTYLIEESKRGAGHDLFLTGTGEVGLMGLHADEILDESMLPLQYATVSTCFRREAGAAGRDTAGLYRVHQFDKVEQVVICRADEAESRAWHQRMIGIVEGVLQSLELPYRLLQCCAGDLGPKNADMIDVECWMPGRGAEDDSGRPTGAYGETHSASRLYDFQCRRLNLRYRGESTGGKTAFCHSLNNTVLASPRFLVPLLEMHQQADGSVSIPAALRPYLGGDARIG